MSESAFEKISVAPDYTIPPAIIPVLRHFDRILGVPRPSGKEEAIRYHLRQLAESKGLKVRTDEVGNLAIEIPASLAHENQSRVILQGHMDMVPYGGNDTRATTARISDDGWMTAIGGTTLGADNGIALAMAFALIEDKTSLHGPITLLITVDEERGLTGANQLDPNIIAEDAALLINLDSEEGETLICRGSAGGMNLTAKFDITQKTVIPADYAELEIDISGLRGGHSGVDIHEQRGNAIRMLNGIILMIRTDIDPDLKLIEFTGGSRRNAIPRDARARIAIPRSKLSKTLDLIADIERQWRITPPSEADLNRENAASLSLQATLGQEKTPSGSAISNTTRDRILTAIDTIPNGPQAAMGGYNGGVLLSSNLGILDKPRDADGNIIDENCLMASVLVRAAETEKLYEKAHEIADVFQQAGAHVERSGVYEGWLEAERSPAVRLAIEEAREIFGEAKSFTYHAGLEASIIKNRLAASKKHRRDVSAVAIGPVIKNPHGPEESVNLDSVDNFYRLLKSMLQKVE